MWAPEFEPGEAEKRGLVPQFALADARQPPPPGGAAEQTATEQITGLAHQQARWQASCDDRVVTHANSGICSTAVAFLKCS